MSVTIFTELCPACRKEIALFCQKVSPFYTFCTHCKTKLKITLPLITVEIASQPSSTAPTNGKVKPQNKQGAGPWHGWKKPTKEK